MTTGEGRLLLCEGVVYYDDHGDHGNHNDDGSRSSALPAAGVVPVFTDKDSNRMAYVGVSEDLFKSAGQALYDHGPFELTVPQVNSVAKFFLNKVGLSEGPVEVQLTGVPVIKINKDGVSVKVEAIAQSLDKPDLPVECKFGIKVDLNGHRLILQYLSPKCEAKPGTRLGKAAAAIAKSKIRGKIKSYIENWFNEGEGIQIPLPDGLDLTQTKIDYHDGYLVVGGDLTFTG